MTAANESSALRTGFKIGNKAIDKNAALAMSKFGTRTLELALGSGLFSLNGSSVANAEDGILEAVTMPDANTGNMRVAFELPAEWDSTPTDVIVEIYWKATVTTGDAKFTGEMGMKASGEDVAVTETQTVVTTTNTTADKINKSLMTFTGSNFAAGDLIGLNIKRDPADASDTLATDLKILGVIIKFTGIG